MPAFPYGHVFRPGDRILYHVTGSSTDHHFVSEWRGATVVAHDTNNTNAERIVFDADTAHAAGHGISWFDDDTDAFAHNLRDPQFGIPEARHVACLNCDWESKDAVDAPSCPVCNDERLHFEERVLRLA